MLSFFVTRTIDPEWGEYYSLTVAGYTAVAVILLVLILFAGFLAGLKKKSRMKAKELAFCAIALALAFVTSTYIKLVHMPMGGSITLFSMLFVTLIGYLYGLRTGLTAATAYGLIQFVTGPWIISLPQVIFDYVLSFGALGLSGLFSGRRHGLMLGYITGVCGRFVFSFISGMLFFATTAESYDMSVPFYSFAYNGAYIFGEGLLTVLLLSLPAVRKAFAKVRAMT